MNAVAEHMAALGRLYGPGAAELRQSIVAGCQRAADMASGTHTARDCATLDAQLHGLVKSVQRLRGQLPEVTHAPA